MLPLRIALRYLFSKKTHNAVNVISLISVAGVAVATMAMVCVLSVFNGFTDLAVSQLSHIAPDLKITPHEGKEITSPDSIVAIIKNIEGIESISPVIEEQAFAVYNEKQIPVNIKGVAHDYDSISEIPRIIIDGTFLLDDGEYSYATLSVGAAISLQASPHYATPLELYTPKRHGRVNVANPMASVRHAQLIIGGVYQVNQHEYDSNTIIIPIEMARQLLDYTSQATAIEINVARGYSSQDIAHRLSNILSDKFDVKNRIEQQEESFRMIEIEKWITFLMLAFILIIASFNIISTLSLLIIEKQENIATMRAMGASNSMITQVFTLEGWLISVSGGIIGLLLGIILTLAQQWGKIIKLGGDPSAMFIDAYPVRLDAVDLMVVFAVVLAIGFFTSQVTAWGMRRRH